jgi:uncharacterized protein
VFKEERSGSMFHWAMLGDIAEGRPNLGQSTTVAVYRLMQFTLRDVLIRQFGADAADRCFFEAGKIAGRHFYDNLITRRASLPEFISDLQEALKRLQIGILRVEKAEIESMTFTLTVAEDLDCSGLPFSNEEICTYDEGFISGLLLGYSGIDFTVKEVDCWCSGDRVCRFEARPTGQALPAC